MDKIVDITDRYSHELNSIYNITRQLKNGRIYELTDVKTDGSLYTQITKLEDELSELVNKIEYDKDSVNERIRNLSMTNISYD